MSRKFYILLFGLLVVLAIILFAISSALNKPTTLKPQPASTETQSYVVDTNNGKPINFSISTLEGVFTTPTIVRLNVGQVYTVQIANAGQQGYEPLSFEVKVKKETREEQAILISPEPLLAGNRLPSDTEDDVVEGAPY
jgi:hypothetical protein